MVGRRVVAVRYTQKEGRRVARLFHRRLFSSRSSFSSTLLSSLALLLLVNCLSLPRPSRRPCRVRVSQPRLRSIRKSCPLVPTQALFVAANGRTYCSFSRDKSGVSKMGAAEKGRVNTGWRKEKAPTNRSCSRCFDG
jgi:hypothetical protein